MLTLSANRSTLLSPRLLYPLLVLALLLALLPLAATPLAAAVSPRVRPGEVPAGLTAAGWTAIQDAVRPAAYDLTYREAEGAYQAPNRGQGWAVAFTPAGVRVTPPAARWQWGLALTAYGYAGDMTALAQPPGLHADRANLTYLWDDNLSEWWLNDPAGLEQGFTLRARPGRGQAQQGQGQAQPLRIDMALRGSLTAVQRGEAIVFSDGSGTGVLTYDRLQVSDATGAVIPAHLELVGRDGGAGATPAVLRIVVDDRSARYPLTIDSWMQNAKLSASDGAVTDYFGYVVAVSGDTVLVGAPLDDIGANSSQGSAYVFVKPSGGWATTSTFDAKLTASDGAGSDQFGIAVAVSGDTVVVGAAGDNGNQGAAYVFVKPSGGWATTGTFDAKLTATDGAGADYFGIAVAVSGDTAVVGAYGDDSFQGAAYVFVKPPEGWTTATETAKLTASDGAGADYFGIAVAVSGDTAVVGAYGDDGLQGAAYVFVKPSGGWSTAAETAKLTASRGAGGDYFGISVAVSGDTAVVGAYGDDGNRGSAYVFVKPSGGWATATETARLTASDGAGADYFGISAAVSGSTVLVGASGDNGNQGAAYVFVKPSGGWITTTQTAKLTAADGAAGDLFGRAVAVSGGTVLVGAALDDIGPNGDQGSAYVFGGPSTCYDFNISGQVDALDIAAVAGRWANVALYDPTYDVAAPFGVIDMLDIITVAGHFGLAC